ncbi:MBOAT family protein [Anaerocolumna aminovalerica]|jgi:alginate O-acetyltransferase complex protein AlgI|uniref:Alginate O-acetyltransferase complex protein AlgI n=1 Tax=Anaerocolumna aminovalerica TaxID=1527 RepID=A0A1I5DAD4_9FIRM|nr:MBOAT family O-acyltransferase [Anaerocolumna aminovalerica]MBU5333818.1 MBOAT family protein [Anaerocolumna aminovalerica]MDU6263111.1 MBOAT family O-acyltransferase [Anaerocolumna aminovalerica]SFN96076.1 alginate O-acetyltransferase complex protein AlgI [Anaerocolumna aminovalerica]
MLFSSLLFIFQFLPVFFIIYYLSPIRFRNLILFLASVFFYAWGEPRFVILILISILINYIAGIFIERYDRNEKIRVTILVLSIIYNIGTLMFFKYFNFIIENINYIFKGDISFIDIPLPLGISFYTFQIMSYTIDVYRRDTKAERSYINLGAYLCMFPQLIAGPIVVYTQVSKELRKRSYYLKDIEKGLRIFILGLGSKVLIANNVGGLWDDMAQIGYANISMPLAWLGLLSFSLQIYFDFNGYSLMAIGLGKMLGFDFPQNFNFPYISKSVTEYWRRWHITLSTWFKEYLYIPLGGNRKGKLRTYINLFIVWSVTGLWHGASWNFIFWGIYFFVLLSLEKLFLKKWLEKNVILSRIYTILAILLGWMIFAITELENIKIYFGRLFSFSISEDWIYYLRNYGMILVIGILFSTPFLKKWYDKQANKILCNILLLVIFLLSIAYLVDAAYNPFLYFRF